MKSNWLGLMYGIGASSIWGGMYVVSKVVLAEIPPFTLLSLRLVLGIVALWLVVTWQRSVNLSTSIKLQAAAVGIIGYGFSLGFQFVGTRLSTASNGALVTSATPAFVFFFAVWILGEKVTTRKLAALAVSTIGVLMVLDPRSANLEKDLFWGNLSLVAAAITWALYSVLVRKLTTHAEVLPLTLFFFCGGLLVGIPGSFVELSRIPIGIISPGLVAGILYLGLISTALAMVWWNLAFAKLEAGLAALTFFAQPLVGVVLGAVLLGEHLSALFILGGILIGVGLWFSSK